jgi:hypothetical protein
MVLVSARRLTIASVLFDAMICCLIAANANGVRGVPPSANFNVIFFMAAVARLSGPPALLGVAAATVDAI